MQGGNFLSFWLWELAFPSGLTGGILASFPIKKDCALKQPWEAAGGP